MQFVIDDLQVDQYLQSTRALKLDFRYLVVFYFMEISLFSVTKCVFRALFAIKSVGNPVGSLSDPQLHQLIENSEHGVFEQSLCSNP